MKFKELSNRERIAVHALSSIYVDTEEQLQSIKNKLETLALDIEDHEWDRVVKIARKVRYDH